MIDKSFLVSVLILTLLAALAVVFIALYFTKPFHVYPAYAPDITYTITDAWDLSIGVNSYTIFNTNSQIRSIGFTMPNALNFSNMSDISILYSASEIPYEPPTAIYAVEADGQLNTKNGLDTFNNGVSLYYNTSSHAGRFSNDSFKQDQTFTFLFSNSIANESLTFFTSWNV